MIEFLKSWVISIITLVIFIVLVEILIPSNRTRKYINMVSGFILLIVVLNPFLKLLSKGIDLKDVQMTGSNFIDQKWISDSSKYLQDNEMKQITEVYRKKIIYQVKESLKDVKGVQVVQADAIINEDYSSENYGEVMKVFVELNLTGKNSNVRPVSQVQKVKVHIGSKQYKLAEQDKGVDAIPEDLKNKVQDKINKRLSVPRDNIIVTLQK